MEKNDRLKLFVNELNYISDIKLRELAKELLLNADDYFFEIAASTTGKYHPKFDLGPMGLVRHTRCVTFMAYSLAESSQLSIHDRDLLIIAAIAHDIKKLGNDGSKYTVNNHPTLAKNYILELYFNNNNNLKEISNSDIEKICGAVESHMGKWGAKDGLPMPNNEFEKLLQNADYIASRKEILDFNFAPTEEVSLVENNNEESKTIVVDGNYVLEFGKHKGKTLDEVKSTGYLEWVAKQEEFFNKEVQNIIKEYLASNKCNNNEIAAQKSVTESVDAASKEIDYLPF